MMHSSSYWGGSGNGSGNGSTNNSNNHHHYGDGGYTSQTSSSSSLSSKQSTSASASTSKSKSKQIKGIVKTSWSFQYATYPFIYAKNDSVVFQGKCFLLGEELMPLLVNMKGVVEQREFFQRDNYLMLASIRRSLVEHIEALHKPSHAGKKILNHELRRMRDVHDGKTERDVIRILEGALLSLGRCCDMVKPAGLHVGSVSKEDWRRALRALEHSMSEIRTYCDPDRPLLPSEWGKLVDDDAGGGGVSSSSGGSDGSNNDDGSGDGEIISDGDDEDGNNIIINNNNNDGSTRNSNKNE